MEEAGSGRIEVSLYSVPSVTFCNCFSDSLAISCLLCLIVLFHMVRSTITELDWWFYVNEAQLQGCVTTFLQRLKLAIPDGQNFHQKVQALASIKIQISIHQKKALSKLCRTITLGHWGFTKFTRFETVTSSH